MSISFFDRVSSKWSIFRYNFGWSNFAWLFENWIAKSTFLVPILGYVILFNDQIAALVKFDTIANETALDFGLSAIDRLRLIYLGLLFVGVAQASYMYFRPSILKFSSDIRGYVDYGLNYFTLGDFLGLHDAIGYSDSGPISGYGDYSTREWEDFIRQASGTVESSTGSDKTAVSVSKGANWSSAKAKHEDLLKSILKETFAKRDRQKRILLSCTLSIVTCGYLLLLVPSADLTIKVLASIWLDWF